jgi:hypothetical protein
MFNGVVATVAAQRDAQEAAAKTRLLALLEEPMRAFVKTRLESPDLNTQVSITGIPGNPEAAAVLGEIYAIKEARHADAYLSEQRALASLRAAPVTVALWRPPQAVEYSAILVRTPGGLGQNIILLKDGDATADRLAQALRILARSRAAEGEFPSKLVRRYAAGVAPRASGSEQSVVLPIVGQLGTAANHDIPGYGSLPAVTFSVAPIPRPSSPHP